MPKTRKIFRRIASSLERRRQLLASAIILISMAYLVGVVVYEGASGIVASCAEGSAQAYASP